MATVALTNALKPHLGEVWHLEQQKKGLLLRSGEEVITTIKNGEASLRIQFPSFWASRAFLVIHGDGGEFFCFEPKKPEMAKVRELIEDCLDEAPRAAAAAMDRKANRDLLIGGGSLLLGLVITVATFALAAPGGTFVVMTGLLVIGAIEIVRGIYWKGQAGKRRALIEQQE